MAHVINSYHFLLTSIILPYLYNIGNGGESNDEEDKGQRELALPMTKPALTEFSILPYVLYPIKPFVYSVVPIRSYGDLIILNLTLPMPYCSV